MPHSFSAGPERHWVLRRIEHISAEPDLRGRSGRGRQDTAEMVQYRMLRRSSFRKVGQRELRGDHRSGINNWNIATAKRIRMPYSEGHTVELRADFLNAFNHTQFLASDKNLRSVSYGRINAVRPPRQIQFALRYLF